MPDAHLHAGQVLGGWTLRTLLQAERGVSTWQATATDQIAVLKVFSEPVDAGVRRTLQRNVRRLQGLSVDGVVAPLQLASRDEGMVVVREKVEGTPLFDVLRERTGPDQVALAVELAAKLFRVLADLHREHLVHGQLSPGNVWVAPNGAIRLTDIGTSRAVLGGPIKERPGRLPPTAPEVAAGWGPRPATDIHAAGALFYAALFPAAGDLTDRTVPWGLGASEAPLALALCRPDVPARLSMLLQHTQTLDWGGRPSAAELWRELSTPERWTQPAPLPQCPLRIGQSGSLDTAVRHLQRPGPRLVLLAGPSGCGRHRLADALMRIHIRSHRPPIVIRADRAETGSLMVRTLRRLAGPDQHAARRKRLLRDLDTPLASLWPEFANPDHTSTAEALDARVVIDAGVEVTHRSLADRPMLLVLDALEDADPLSLRWMHGLLDGEREVRVVAIVDDRWQTDEFRRMRSRLSDRAAVLEVTLPDLNPGEVDQVVALLTRSVSNIDRSRATAPASPARATERGHRLLAEWRGEEQPTIDAAATVFGLLDELPAAALHTLDIDPAEVIRQHLAVVDRPGWLRRRHSGIAGLGQRGMARRDRHADRLATALEATDCPTEQLARVRLLGTEDPRTACARAAIDAWNADRPQDTRRWLHVVDRLPRDSKDPGYRSIRAHLARVRAEVAFSADHSGPRAALLQQAVRRARSPDEQASLPYAVGLAALREGSSSTALRAWKTGSTDPLAHPISRARCGNRLHDWHLNAGDLSAATEALEALRAACRVPDLPRGPRRWMALAESRHALALGQPQQAATHLTDWLASPDALPDHDAQLLLAHAKSLAGQHAEAQAAVHEVLDQAPHHAEARVLHSWLALQRGDTRAAHRAYRQLSPASSPSAHRLALDLRLAAAQGEQHRLPEWLGRPAPSRRPDLWSLWMSTVLSVLRTVHEPGLRELRHTEARESADTNPYPSLHLALAWQAVDDADWDAVHTYADHALARAKATSANEQELRAQMLAAAAHPSNRDSWTHLVDRSTPHPMFDVRADIGELSAVLAMRTGSPDVADQWVQYLSGLAQEGANHALAARATNLHRRIQSSLRRPNGR